MTLKERFKAKESNVGKFFKIQVTYFFTAVAAVGAVLDYAQILPEGLIPTWMKTTIAVAAIVSRIYGQLTVHPSVKDIKNA